jgi:hypothetical protein
MTVTATVEKIYNILWLLEGDLKLAGPGTGKIK